MGNAQERVKNVKQTLTSSDHVADAQFSYSHGGYTLSKKECFAHSKLGRLNNNLINNQKMQLLLLTLDSQWGNFIKEVKDKGDFYGWDLYVRLYRKPSIWNYNSSDEGNQGLQFAWMTIAINPSRNTKVLVGRRINLVDNFIVKLWMLLPGDTENINFLYGYFFQFGLLIKPKPLSL